MAVPQVKEYSGETMPEWAKEGGTVAVVRGSFRDQTAYFYDVERVTATQVIVDGQKYNLKKNLNLMGERSTWSPRTFLADPDSLEVRYAVLRQKKKNMEYKVQDSAEKFRNNPGNETASQIEIWLGRWRTVIAQMTSLEASFEPKQ